MMVTGSATGGEYREAASIVPGVNDRHEQDFTVEGDLLTDVAGSLDKRILSTPGMILMMERTCSALAAEHLDDGQVTVGFEVCIKHVGSAAEGATCTARATLREIADERKFRFDVEVVDGDRTIGVGTHERRAIEP
jgi:fluoroacetyl-CoA thioesterase